MAVKTWRTNQIVLKAAQPIYLESGAFTASAMTSSPSTTAETGYITINCNGTNYKIPFYVDA
jgi:hypothetical protein